MKKALPLFILAAGLIVACAPKKDTPTPTPNTDPRDKMVGSYTMIDSFHLELSKVGLGNDTTQVDTVTLKITKSSTDASRLDFTETHQGDVNKFYVTGVKAVNGGEGFMIPSQTIADSGSVTTTVAGTTTWTIDGTKYDGGLISGMLKYGYAGSAASIPVSVHSSQLK